MLLTNGQERYEIVADYQAPNYGLLGGELHVRLVQLYDGGHARRMGDVEFAMCSETPNESTWFAHPGRRGR